MRTDGDQPDPTLVDLERVQQRGREQAEATDRAAQLGTRTVRRMVQRQARTFGLVGIAAAVLISVLAVFLASSSLSQSSATEALRLQRDDQTRSALASLDQANSALRARGQAPVGAPPNPDDPSAAITAAVAARVIAQLPPSPTAQQVADLVAPAALARVTGPTTQQLADAVAGYYQANPPARGPRGEPGPGPTADQIDAAVAQEYAANPPPPGRDGTDGTDGRDGAPGADGRSITGSFQDPDDPCTRVLTFSQPPTEERWNTCPSAPPPAEPEPTTSAPPTTTD